MRLRRILLIILPVVGVGLWYALHPTPVVVVMPHRGDAAEVVYATGVVEPRVWAKVTPLVRERIIALCNCEGKSVEAGAVLARLDNSEAEAALRELEARRRIANADLTRLIVLDRRNVASPQALDRARSEVAQLEALIAGQTARLENYVLRAPSSGVVLREDGEVGEIAEPGTVLFWVGRPNPRVVIADVNEEDIPRVAVGQRALLRSDAFPGRSLEAVVENITPKGDPVTKTYRVRFRLPEDTPLMIGMTVDVNVVIRVAEDALLVPTLAVRGNAVHVVEGDSARRREIETGIRGTASIEVLSGLTEDARLVSPYPDGLKDGTRVIVEGQ